MLLTETCMVIFDHAVTYVDALSAVAAILIVAFIGFISVRQHINHKKNK